MTTIHYKHNPESGAAFTRTYGQCDYCQRIIGVNVSVHKSRKVYGLDVHLCGDCINSGIVFCRDCMKPHPKKQTHKITCSRCQQPFTATIEYQGMICAKCMAEVTYDTRP